MVFDFFEIFGIICVITKELVMGGNVMSTLIKIGGHYGFLALRQTEDAYSILYRPRKGLFGLCSNVVEILPDKYTWISLRYRNVRKPELRDAKGKYEFFLPRECFTRNFIGASCEWKYPEVETLVFGDIIEMPNFGDFFGYYIRDDDVVFVVMSVEGVGIISTPLDKTSFILSTERRKPRVNGFGLVYLPPEFWGRLVAPY